MSADQPADGRPAQDNANEGNAGEDQPQAPPDEVTGADLARAMLDAARAKGPARRTSDKGRWREEPQRRRGLRGYTGPGPDSRDPQPFGALLAKLIKDRGWQQPAAEGAVFGAWERVVGAEIAAKSRPVKLEDGELTVEAVSTAWATQLRLLTKKIITKIAREVGPNVVTRLRIHGPAAPSWRHGPRRVRGKGPGDTYG